MTIPLTGAGSLFVRLGHEMGRMLDINALRGSSIVTARVLATANLATKFFGSIMPDYAAGTAIPQIIQTGPADLSAYQSQMGAYLVNLQGYAQNTVRAMYGIDQLAISSQAPLSVFAALNLSVAMNVLVVQMNNAGQSVQAATVASGAQTAVGSPNGNPVIVLSLKNGMGQTLQTPFAETLTFTCTLDSQGGATEGNEQITINGQTAVADTLNWLYPGGSGVISQKNCVDGQDSNTGGNMLVNGDFGTYTTANYPDNWVIVVGTAGTQVKNSGTPYLSGGGVVEMVGDGATKTTIQQQFAKTRSTSAGAGGSPATFVPNGVYHFNGWVRLSAIPQFGELSFSLVDGSGNIINDAAGTPNVVYSVLGSSGSTGSASGSISGVSGAGVTYTAINGAFRTPGLLPASGIFFRIKQVAPVDLGVNIYFGDFTFTRVDASGNGIYPGGPFASIHSGSGMLLDGLMPDQWQIQLTNTYQVSGSGLMQLMMDRLFGMRVNLGSPALQLPFAASPTISDTLIA